MSAEQIDLIVKDSISVLATRLAKKIERYADQYLHEITNIGVYEWRLLVHVYSYKTKRVADIADALILDMDRLLSVFADLDEKHLVKLVETPEGHVIEPTTVGEGLYNAILPHWIAHQKKIGQGLPDEELALVSENIKTIIEHLDSLIVRNAGDAEMFRMISRSGP